MHSINENGKKVKLSEWLYTISSVLEFEIKLHFTETNKVWPEPLEALGFTATELGEAFDLLLELGGDWTRNNPERHVEDNAEAEKRLARELGDIIMMAMVTGMVLDLHPLTALFEKFREKERERGN